MKNNILTWRENFDSLSDDYESYQGKLNGVTFCSISEEQFLNGNIFYHLQFLLVGLECFNSYSDSLQELQDFADYHVQKWLTQAGLSAEHFNRK